VTAFAELFRRDLSLAWGSGGGLLAVLFYTIVATLVAMGVGPDLPVLARVAPGVLWVGVALATLLSLDRLYQADWEDGSLDLILLSPQLLEAAVLAKAAAFWIANLLPVIAAAPIVAMLLNLPGELYGPVLLSLVIGTPALVLIGGIGAALTVGLRRGGLLLALLVLPLFVPVLIFGALAAADPDPLGPSMLLLAAFGLFALVIGPFASAAALRLNVRG
jgi:heme exporter protein B